jgi:gamma-glutamyltranspeptidase/glutathione hydrolase
MLTDQGGNLVSAFGCMGGYMQPQAHLQLLINLLDHGLDPQAALDAPRWLIDRLDSAVGPASVAASHVLLVSLLCSGWGC